MHGVASTPHSPVHNEKTRRVTSLTRSISSRDGLAATFELYRDGHTRRGLTAAVRSGAVIRVRQGWYLLPGTHPHLVAAARVGGRLTCLNAAQLHGLWTVPSPVLHVAVSSDACRLRHPLDKTVRIGAGQSLVRVHWRTPPAGGSRLLLDLTSCLADVLRCAPVEDAVATADSALFRGAITRAEWARLVAEFAPQRRGLDLVEPRCESGTESLTLFRLRPFRLPMRCQVRIHGIGRVDFLIGTRLVVEVDGAGYHTDPERFEADRRRDAVLSRIGYRVLRFSYKQVMYRWDEVEAAILAAVFRGDHH